MAKIVPGHASVRSKHARRQPESEGFEEIADGGRASAITRASDGSDFDTRYQKTPIANIPRDILERDSRLCEESAVRSVQHPRRYALMSRVGCSLYLT